MERVGRSLALSRVTSIYVWALGTAWGTAGRLITVLGDQVDYFFHDNIVNESVHHNTRNVGGQAQSGCAS